MERDISVYIYCLIPVSIICRYQKTVEEKTWKYPALETFFKYPALS